MSSGVPVLFSREGCYDYFFCRFPIAGNLFQVFWLSTMGCRFIHGHVSLRTLLLGSGSRLSFPIIRVFVLLGVGTAIFCFALGLSFSTALEVPAPSFKSSLLVLPSLSRF